MNDEPKRVLIIKPSALGDVVLALPALSRLRQRYPEAEIDWLVRPEFAPLLQRHPYIRRLILFDRKQLGRMWPLGSWMKQFQSLVHELRSGSYDVVYDFQGLLRTAFFARLTRADRCIGMEAAREGAAWFYTHRVPQKGTSKHVVDYYLSMVDPQWNGKGEGEVNYVLPEQGEARGIVEGRLREKGVKKNHYVVVVPGSAHVDKCWPLERFAELIQRIDENCQLPVVLVGSQGELKISRQLEGLSQGRIINWVGQTNLPELRWILGLSGLVISNDTGPGHLAVAQGVPLVMMFSWSNPARIYPYGRSECMVARDPFTRPNGIRSRDPRHNIDQIQVDEVWEKVQQQL